MSIWMVLLIKLFIKRIYKHPAFTKAITLVYQLPYSGKGIAGKWKIRKILNIGCILIIEHNCSNLENITNSKKDLVGKIQLCMTDHVSPSVGIGGRELKLCFTPYIFFRASENANLQIGTEVRENSSPWRESRTKVHKKIGYESYWSIREHQVP